MATLILSREFLQVTCGELMLSTNNQIASIIQIYTNYTSCRHKLADQKTRKTLERGDFRLLHYAGEVTYCVVGKTLNTIDIFFLL